MESRQDRPSPIEDALPVSLRHSLADLCLIGLGLLSPAVDVVTGIRLRVLLGAAVLHAVEGVGPGGHCLGLQRLQRKGGRHFRPDHSPEIGLHIHLLQLPINQHPQHGPRIYPGRGGRILFCVLRLHRRRRFFRLGLRRRRPPQPGKEKDHSDHDQRQTYMFSHQYILPFSPSL